jgi:hypothetical protein
VDCYPETAGHYSSLLVVDTNTILIIILVLVIALVVGYFLQQAENKRQEAFRTWAQLHNWSYDHRRDREIHRQYSFLNVCSKAQIGMRLTFSEADGANTQPKRLIFTMKPIAQSLTAKQQRRPLTIIIWG